MTALTAKAGSAGSLRNDSFDGQSCLGGFEALAGQSWIQPCGSFEALAGQSWIP